MSGTVESGVVESGTIGPLRPRASVSRRVRWGGTVSRRVVAAWLLALVALAPPLFAVPAARAAEPVLAFENPADEARYAKLLEGYRCLKCQNQNLEDSGAALAADLRHEIYERVVAGEPDAAIDDYLVARYGDFVLYRPRLTLATALLWIGPFVLLALALAGAVVVGRRSGRGAPAPAPDALEEARRLLGERPQRR